MTGPLLDVAGALLALAALPALVASAYLALLALLARRPAVPTPPQPPRHAFDVIVPAHDEEAGIVRTVESLLALDYPAALYRVIVVADNCSDRTAALARGAGAHVLERHDAERRGKGFALAHAYAASLADGVADAVVVVDADTVASPNLLAAFAARLAAGEQAAQADYGVRNAAESWRTRLMTIAFALFHGVRSLGRERLRLSCGLRGNGMAFTHDCLRRVPHRAFSIVEDLEYGIQLGHAGVRVAYVAEAHVRGDMPGSERASRSQRERWEGGRRAVLREHARPLVTAALRGRSALLLDLAMDVLVPPLTQLVALTALGAAASLVALGLGVAAWPAVALWGAALLGLAAYVGRGLALSGLGARGLLDLLWAPVYVAWKLAHRLRPGRRDRSGAWVRTARVPEGG